MFNLSLPSLPVFISYLFVLIVAFTIHELAHALTATYFGDETPRLNGRLTLNPLAHLDPIGSILLLLVGFGWAKPVPINPYVLQRRSPAAVMWVSLAGPLSNLIMAVIAAIPFRLGLISGSTALFSSRILPSLPQFLWIFISTNLVLMLFNLIPIAPLDGEKIADYFFPPSMSRFLDTIRPYGPLILMAVVFLGVLGPIINPPLNFMMRILVG